MVTALQVHWRSRRSYRIAVKDVHLFCAIDIPKYLRYIHGWDRVTSEWPRDRELAIIVDTSSEALLQKLLETTGARAFLESHPVIVLDHHETVTSDLPFATIAVNDDAAVAAGEVYLQARPRSSLGHQPSGRRELIHRHPGR